MKLLIADSGATKTDWAFIENGKPIFFKGEGLHPANFSDSDIKNSIHRTVGKLRPNHIYFFGAGCHSEEVNDRFASIFKNQFGKVTVTVDDDLTGTAKAHIGKENGIIAALGTGSICGRYHGGKITEKSAALGFAIGDEGSAADIGKRILKLFFRNRFDEATHQAVAAALSETSYSVWMQKIYQHKTPSRELAKVAGLVLNREVSPQLKKTVKDSIASFVDEQLSQLQPLNEERIVITGKVAVSNMGILLDVLAQKGFENVEVKGSVIEGLAKFYSP